MLLLMFSVPAMLVFRKLDVSASVSPLARRLGGAFLVLEVFRPSGSVGLTPTSLFAEWLPAVRFHRKAVGRLPDLCCRGCA